MSPRLRPLPPVLGCEPSRILFLDDNEINCTGARAAGFRAQRVQGVVGATQALMALGALGDEASTSLWPK